jgi:hypothetical protein
MSAAARQPAGIVEGIIKVGECRTVPKTSPGSCQRLPTPQSQQHTTLLQLAEFGACSSVQVHDIQVKHR